MELFTADQWAKLRANGQQAATDPYFNPRPVVKLFTPYADFRWLLAWVEPDDESIAYGLCDLGMGCPEIGSFSLSEILAVRGLRVQRDLRWEPQKTLTEYAEDARRAGGMR